MSFDIAFVANDKYLKFTAVLMTSIIKSTQEKGALNQSFHFHIISDFISEKNLKKLNKLKAKLNELFPCELSSYIVKDDFSKFRNYGEMLTHIIYLKLKIASVLPSHIKTCLYLDADMLCIGDIRKLFKLNLKDKILACVLEKKSLIR